MWGGLDGGKSFSADRFEDLPTPDRYNTRTKADQQATIDNSYHDGYPDARRCHSTAKITDQVWMFGGYGGDDVFEDTWQLVLSTMQVARLPTELHLPVYFHVMMCLRRGRW